MTDNNNNKTWTSLFHSSRNYEKEQRTGVLKSESGIFYIDPEGIALRFDPADDNPFMEEETEKEANDIFTTDRSIRTFIVPEGVRGFASGFMRGTRVMERFELPDGLLSIGNNSFDYDTECNCVFADCILSSVVIPDSVKELGIFAFGHSHINSLQLPESLHSPYGRQFKDSYIGTLKLSREWKDGVSIGKHGNLELSGQWLDNEKYGYLRWPTTKIGNLEFY